MKTTLWMLDQVFGRKIANQTQQYLEGLTNGFARASRANASALLKQLAAKPGPHVCLGETE